MKSTRCGLRLLGGLLSLLLLTGCPGFEPPPSFVHPNLDLSFYKRVAVLPLSNFTKEQFAAARVRELVLSEFLLAGVFEILEPGLVDRALARVGVQPGASLNKDEIEKFSKELNIQAFVVGAVEIYEEHRMGAVLVPEVSVELRMIDAESGITVWSIAATEGGIDLATQMLGLRPLTLSEATRIVVRRAVDSLFFFPEPEEVRIEG